MNRQRRRLTAALAAVLAAATVAAPVPTRPVDAFADAELIDATVRGTVFIDFDRDGRVDIGETRSDLVSGRQITVSSTNRQERARSNADGTFSLSLPNLLASDGIEAGLRIEVDPLLDHRETFGTAATRHVRVTDGDDVELLFGFVPESRCPDDPVTLGDPSGRFPQGHPNSLSGKLWTTCFVDGSATSPEGAQDVLVATNVDTDPWEPAEGTEFGGHLDVEHLATKQQTGAIWGLGYDEWDGVVFASAVIKRHSGLGPEGVDGLYWRSSDGERPAIRSVGLDELSPDDAPSFGSDPADCPRLADGSAYAYDEWTFEDTAAGGRWDCRDLDDGGGGSESFDWWAFDRVGRDGIGDIEVTPDGTTLAVLNATADAVFVYDITSIGPEVTDGGPVYVRHLQVIAPECVRGRTEAWGLTAIDADHVYVGATCTADGSSSVSDLSSVVVRLNIRNGASQTATIVSHDHPHGPGYTADAAPDSGRFRPWSTRDAGGRPVLPPIEDASNVVFLDFLEAYGYSNYLAWHQPLLSDIAIDPDDGSLALAVMDRWSMMTGVFNCGLDPSNGSCGVEFPAPPPGDFDGEPGDDPVAGYTSGIIGYVAGDLIRACNTSTDPENPTLVVEGGPGCDPSEHSPRFPDGFGGGPAGDVEWYWNDQAFTGSSTDSPHPEASQGAVAQLDQRGDVVYTAMNPIETFGAGLSRDAHADGEHVAGVQFFRTDFRDSDGTGWKSAGLGDVEGCSIPLEIGDHVWFDENVDGIRDPEEPPLGGVAISLVEAASGLAIATTVSDASGRWSFTTADGLEAFQEYLIRFTIGRTVSVEDVESFELVPTLMRTAGVRSDLDSDLVTPESNGLPFEIPVRTGAPGESDHTIDAGFAPIGSVGQVEVIEDERPGPPWRTLGLLFAGIAAVGTIGVLLLKRFVW